MTKFQHFIESVLRLALEHRASVTSWVRTTKRNTEVGGHPASQHLTGTAVDLVLDDFTRKEELLKAARKLNLIAIDEGDHIHIQLYKATP